MARRVVFLVMAVLALMVAPALAANPHFVEGPVFSDEGTQLNATGSIAGLGNENITVVLDAVGVADVECTNKGGTKAPGQQKELSFSGSQTDIEVKNGRADFDVTTEEATLGSGKGNTSYRGCPNGNWTPEITNVEFTSGTLTVYQGGEVVLQETYTP